MFQGDLKFNVDFRSVYAGVLEELAQDPERADPGQAVRAVADCLSVQTTISNKAAQAPIAVNESDVQFLRSAEWRGTLVEFLAPGAQAGAETAVRSGRGGRLGAARWDSQ